MKNVNQYLEKFYNVTRKPTLNAMNFFMEEFNNFQKEMKFIHIAGTNGKGSCVEMINNILISQGYKVGKFISPHLIKYNERISINGKNITDEEVMELIEELEPKIEAYNENNEIGVSYFELITIISLLYFYRNKVDFVVLEVGLGGEFDCTNIITNPLVSIITSIGYDHMHILGNTLQEIAYQKAGIIKENSNTVIFEQEKEVNDVFINTCKERKNKLHIVKKENINNYNYDENYQYFDYKDLNKIPVILKGKIQTQNASLCIECIKILNDLGYEVSEESIKKGLKTVIHKGRMEVINKSPLIIYDGAHNEPAILNLKNTIDECYKNCKRTYIISILKRKDYSKMLEVLLKDENATFILTSGNNNGKYATSEELLNVAEKYNKDGQDIKIMSLDEAIRFAMNNKDEINFVIGSFYVYGEVIEMIENIIK